MFWGALTALITPFKNDKIDFNGLEKHIQAQLDAGVHGLVPVGTTGEAPTLSVEEHRDIIALTVELVKGRVPIIAGTASSSTKICVELSQTAEALGVDGILFTPPAYNKPSQNGIYEHTKKVHDHTNVPIILYSNPGRTACDYDFETIKKLSELPRIAAIKDSSGDMLRVLEMDTKLPDLTLLSGDDNSMFGFLAQGGVGCISVVANVIPGLSAQLQEAWKKNDREVFVQIRKQITPLLKALSLDTNPVAIKYAVSLLGICDAQPRLPLTPLDDFVKEEIKAAMQMVGVL